MSGKDGETLPWCIGVIGNRIYSVGKVSGELTVLGFEFMRDQGLSRHVVDGKVVPVHESTIGGWYCILKTGRTIPALCELLDNYIGNGIYDSQIDWQKSTITTDKQTAYKTIEAIKNDFFCLMSVLWETFLLLLEMMCLGMETIPASLLIFEGRVYNN